MTALHILELKSSQAKAFHIALYASGFSGVISDARTHLNLRGNQLGFRVILEVLFGLYWDNGKENGNY